MRDLKNIRYKCDIHTFKRKVTAVAVLLTGIIIFLFALALT
jgi:hypothetical protein